MAMLMRHAALSRRLRKQGAGAGAAVACAGASGSVCGAIAELHAGSL